MLLRNQTKYLELNIPNEQGYTMVKTGVEADGNCFFHCVLRAINSSYKTLPVEDKLKEIKQTREQCAASIAKFLPLLGGGELRAMLFLTSFREKIKNGFPPDATGNTLNSSLKPSKLLEYYERAQSASRGQVLSSFLNILKERIHPSLHNYVVKFIQQCISETESEVLEELRANMLQMGKEIDAQQIEIVSRTLGLNFIFIDGDRLDIYKGVLPTIDEKWDTVILLWINQSHYELVGYRDEDYYITRRFKAGHPVLAWCGGSAPGPPSD